MSTPLEALIGRSGDQPACKVYSSDVSMHRYPQGAQPGDTCLCGALTMQAEEQAKEDS